MNFTSPVSVQAGVVYHLVTINTDPNPNTNYVSMDDLWNGTELANPCYPGKPI